MLSRADEALRRLSAALGIELTSSPVLDALRTANAHVG